MMELETSQHSCRIRTKIRALWRSHDDKDAIERDLHQYYLACARRLFPLLPQPESRKGIELGEQFVRGEVFLDDLRQYDWHSEAAVFMIEYDEGSEAVAEMIEDVRSIPKPKLAALLNDSEMDFEGDPKEILVMAAYFANFAMIYPFMRNRGTVSKNSVPFLCPDLFDERFESTK